MKMRIAALALTTVGLLVGLNPRIAIAQSASVPAESATVRSADGTQIGYTRIGSGTIPLVIVHGALSTGANWIPVATALAEHCTCYVMDRWGRGESAHRDDYAFDREADDIVAVLEEAGEGAFLLGHSSGAIYALEAALRHPVAGLILYEPPLHALPAFGPVLDRIRAAADEGRYEDAVAIFVRDEARMSDEEIAFLKSTPMWEQMVALGPQSVTEWVAMTAEDPTVDRYQDLTVPTLMLGGSLTAEHPSFATATLGRTLSDVRTVIIDGQGHAAHLGAPDQVARAVAEFLAEAAK